MAYAYTSRRLTGRIPAAPARKMGTWKLAYADFLTALCAFFLVMWIVHGVTAEDKAELARQFGGETDFVQTTDQMAADQMTSEISELAARLRADPGLLSFGASVKISSEPTLIRIDLTDMATRPLFESGDGSLNQTGQDLIETAGWAISSLDIPLMIEGHTDSNPSLTPGYSNWELSADRANSARRILQDAGVSPARIRAVSGLADTRPLLQQSPSLPANRRISIVLMIHESGA